MKFFDLRNPFFNPLWRRIATVSVTGAWAVFELVSGNPGWSIMFGAVAAYCAYEFFVIWTPQKQEEDQ